MIDRFAERGHADLVAELTHELPALVIFRMLGIPDADVPQVKEWAQSRVYMNFGDRPVDEQVHHAENLVLYWHYCLDLVRSRLESPQDDLPGDLARIYLQGDQTLTPDEIAGLVYGQLVADVAGRRVIERPVAPERQLTPALDSRQVTAVAELAKRVERHYGCPQDVEWALDGDGRVLLLQSRPETVWSTRTASSRDRPASFYAIGLTSIANTLINPLAARSTPDVDN